MRWWSWPHIYSARTPFLPRKTLLCFKLLTNLTGTFNSMPPTSSSLQKCKELLKRPRSVHFVTFGGQTERTPLYDILWYFLCVEKEHKENKSKMTWYCLRLGQPVNLQKFIHMGCLRISVNHQHNRLGSIKPFRTSLIITILKKFQFRKVLFLKFLLEVRSKILASTLQISLFSIVKFFSFVFSANFNVVDVTYYFVPLTQFNEPTDSLISPFITVWLRPEECERLFIRKNRLWR